MSTKENDQGKIIMYQMLQAEFEELKKQNLMVENRLMDLETTVQAIDEVKGFKKDNESLIPLGSGVYAHSMVRGNDILLDIGAGIMVGRSLSAAQAFLEGRKKEIEEVGKRIGMQSEEVANNINKLTPEVQKIVMESQKRG